MKKFLALLVAGVMILSIDITASAKLLPIPMEEIRLDWIDGYLNYGFDGYLTDGRLNEWEKYYLSQKVGDGSYPYPGEIPYSTSSKKNADSKEEVEYDWDSEAAALEAEASGIPMATSVLAIEENKSVGEYMNNAVVAAPGLDNAVPVAQGGGVIINGEASNQTFSVLTVLPQHTDLAKSQAVSVGGTVLNVVKIDASVYFDTAAVNFYMPGVVSGQNIQVYRYDTASEQWTSVAVTEVREDHVTVNMTSLGILAFIDVPAAE